MDDERLITDGAVKGGSTAADTDDTGTSHALPHTSMALTVTSRKGGVGKSTFSAHTAAALAAMGKRTLLVDCDFGVRCLDLLCGISDDVLFDLGDAAFERVPYERAVCEVMPNLSLIASPIKEKPARDRLVPLFEKLRSSYDFIIFDTPRDSLEEITASALSVFGSETEAAVVMHPYDMALRAAEITGRELEELGISRKRLVINCFEASNVLSGKQPPIVELIDRASIPLLGIVPFDGDIALSQHDGRLYKSLKSKNSAKAFSNMAMRLCGEEVPLFSGFKGLKRRRIIDK